MPTAALSWSKGPGQGIALLRAEEHSRQQLGKNQQKAIYWHVHVHFQDLK